MPAIDQCEDSVISALAKEGWIVSKRPEAIRLEAMRFLYVDLMLKHADGRRIAIVEVKCFPTSSTELDELYRSIGQYILYRAILVGENRTEPLYLAIPKPIYETLFQISAIQSVIDSVKINLIVVDLEKEEIVLWKI